MTKNSFINLLIVVLTSLAVVQTGGLWLSQTKSHNLFYSAVNNFFVVSDKTTEYYRPIDAETIAVGTGNNHYTLLHGNESKKLRSSVKNAIGSAFEKGSENSSGSLDWMVLSGKNIVLDFPFSVSWGEFSKGFSSSFSPEVAFDSFDTVVITPSYADNGTYVTFINKSEQMSVSIVTVDEKINSSLRTVIDETKTSDLAYISSAQSGFNIFKNNVFLPQWTEEKYTYSPVNVINACSDSNGAVTMATVKKMVQPLFAASSIAGSGIDENGIFFFTNDEIVVKYYPNGILEYFSYSKSDSSQTLASAYDACMTFIENDTSITTDVFLTDAEASTEGLIFRFDYSVNSMPVTFSEELKEEMGFESAIEVVVTNNTVKKYRKYACEFKEDTETELSASVDFLTEINRVITDYSENGEILQVDNISLCYYVDKNNVSALKWITNLGGKTYVGDTIPAPHEGE